MVRSLSSRIPLTLTVAALLVAAAAPAVAQSADTAQRLAALKSAGPKTTLLIYPVKVTGKPSALVADVLGGLLEHYGMPNVDMTETAFAPAADAKWEDAPAAFAAFLKQNPPPAAYALYAEYLGEPKTGPTEVRWILTTAAGELIISDRQTPTDADFKQTAAKDPDPMGCSVLVGERLFKLADWKKSSSEGDSQGRFARKWAAKSGLPSDADRAAMTKRLEKCKAAFKTSRVAVYATMLGDKPDADSAARLAPLVNKQFGCQAAAAAQPAPVKIAPTSNELKRLWDLARAFRDHLRANPPTGDYAMIAEYLIAPDGGGVHSVHTVVCDKAGEWVVVDLQNNQQDDFQRVAPKTVADCETLTIERIKHWLR